MPQPLDTIPNYLLYGEPVGEAELRFIHVETIAARSLLHDWRIKPHRHEQLQQLMLVEAGGGLMEVDTVELAFAAPSLIATPPRVVHGFRFEPGTGGYVLTLAESFLTEILHSLQEPKVDAALEAPLLLALTPEEVEQHRLAFSFREVEREFRWPSLGRTSAIAAHLKLIVVALARLAVARRRADAVAGSGDALLLGRFRHLVEAHHAERWTIGDYARALGLTEARLNAVCQRAAGASALKLVHARLLLEAKRNLIYTSMSISEVAYALGFQDAAYFSRFFARRCGEPPLAFRARHQVKP